MQLRMLVLDRKNRLKREDYSLSCKKPLRMDEKIASVARKNHDNGAKRYICKKYWTRLHNDAKMIL